MNQLMDAINTSNAQSINQELSLLSIEDIKSLKVENTDMSLFGYCVMQNEITPITSAVSRGIPVEDLIHSDEKSPLLLAMELGDRLTIRKVMRLGVKVPPAIDIDKSEVVEPIRMFVETEKYANMMKKKMTELSNIPARPSMSM